MMSFRNVNLVSLVSFQSCHRRGCQEKAGFYPHLTLTSLAINPMRIFFSPADTRFYWGDPNRLITIPFITETNGQSMDLDYKNMINFSSFTGIAGRTD